MHVRRKAPKEVYVINREQKPMMKRCSGKGHLKNRNKLVRDYVTDYVTVVIASFHKFV